MGDLDTRHAPQERSLITTIPMTVRATRSVETLRFQLVIVCFASLSLHGKRAFAAGERGPGPSSHQHIPNCARYRFALSQGAAGGCAVGNSHDLARCHATLRQEQVNDVKGPQQHVGVYL